MLHTTTDPARAPAPTWRFRVVAWLVIGLVHLARWRVRTTGLEHVPRTGGAVITWNHTSHVDFVLTVWDVYRRLGRPVRYLAMRELWSSRRFGWVARFADAIPVDRHSGVDRDRALADAVEALLAGHLVMVAPEGGIGDDPGALRRFRTGAARMAQLAGVPLVPSASWGTHLVTTTGLPFSFRAALGTRVEIAFGPPCEVDPDDDPVEATARLRDRTSELLADVQARHRTA